jgi:hypothetical protein
MNLKRWREEIFIAKPLEMHVLLRVQLAAGWTQAGHQGAPAKVVPLSHPRRRWSEPDSVGLL